MIYEFKCKATGTVVMTQPVGERMLEIIGKTPGPQGIILPEQMPAAIRALEDAVAAEREQGPTDEEGEDELGRPRPRRVSLAQRAWPLIEMLKDAARAEKEITWGV